MKSYKILFFICLLTLCFLPFSKISAEEITLKTAFTPLPPFWANDKGDIEGIVKDIIDLIEKESSIKIEYPPVTLPAKRGIQNIISGKLDFVMGLNKTPQREKLFHYADLPLYTMISKPVVRIDDPVSIKSFDDIRALKNNGIVICLNKSSDADFLHNQEGLIIDDSGRSQEINFLKLLNKRGRFLLTPERTSIYKMKQPNFKNKFKILPFVAKKQVCYIVFSKHSPKAKIEKLLEVIARLKKEGKIQLILDKYS